jgi:hypothetical protein
VPHEAGLGMQRRWWKDCSISLPMPDQLKRLNFQRSNVGVEPPRLVMTADLAKCVLITR